MLGSQKLIVLKLNIRKNNMSITRINSLGITDGTIVNGDINASAAIASTKLSGVNDAKAWVNFNGTGTPAIRASFNVTSITDDGVGDYTINFTTTLTDANYATIGTAIFSAGTAWVATPRSGTTPTTSAVSIKVVNSGVSADITYINIAVFR